MRELIVKIKARRDSCFCDGCEHSSYGVPFGLCGLFGRELFIDKRNRIHRCRACTSAETKLFRLKKAGAK